MARNNNMNNNKNIQTCLTSVVEQQYFDNTSASS